MIVPGDLVWCVPLGCDGKGVPLSYDEKEGLVARVEQVAHERFTVKLPSGELGLVFRHEIERVDLDQIPRELEAILKGLA